MEMGIVVKIPVPIQMLPGGIRAGLVIAREACPQEKFNSC
jgi:hypothetical protein